MRIKILFLIILYIVNINSIKIYHSCVVDAPIENVWKIIGNFEDLTWNSPHIKIEIEYPEKTTIRRKFLFGNTLVKENLLSKINQNNYKFLKYDFEKGNEAFKVDDYVAKLSAKRVTDSNKTFVVWETRFKLRKGEEQEKEKINELFYKTISKLTKLFDQENSIRRDKVEL